MDMPPGPPSLGESAPPPAPDLPAEAEVEVDHGMEDRERLLADEAANRRLVATTAAFALLAVAVMIGAFLVTKEPSSDDAESAPAAPVATIPTPTTAEPQPDIDQAELDEVIERVRDFVATERGLEFEADVEVVVLGRQAYQDRVRESFDATVDEVDGYLAQHASVYQALGLWPVGADPVAIGRELSAVGSTGFYDVETDQIVMGVSELSPLFETTLAHELTHALDDQHFGIDRPDLFQRSDERAVAFNALAEGDARRVELAYNATLSEDDRTSIEDDTVTATPDFDPDTVPPILLYEQQVTYNDGQTFVQGLVDDGGNAAVDRAFRHPPRTTEEILEPEQFLDGLPPAAVPVPEADGDAVAEGVVGQATLDVITSLGRPEDEDVAEWNGDRYVLWAADTGFCLRVQVDGDAAGLEEQLQSWATEVDAEVAVVDNALTITACH